MIATQVETNKKMSGPESNKLILALDVDSLSKARQLVTSLREMVGMFKVGMQLFTAVGPSIVREIVAAGGKVFLDLKYHDIPNTVACAGIEAARLGVSIFNIHAAGGTEMMKQTTDAVENVCLKEGLIRPKVIAVTLLTSADQQVLDETNVASSPDQQVVKLALLASESGLDGVVASPRETISIRAAVTKPNFLIVTPGVRPKTSDANDQRRITTPAEAIQAGSDYLVVGRPILSAADPVAAAAAILDEIKASFV
jgi:orotidine-5'-phosphate decarboxylase